MAASTLSAGVANDRISMVDATGVRLHRAEHQVCGGGEAT
jgi:hypothetical protein